VYVTAHTNDGSQIDAIPLDNGNTLQTWVVKAVDDGSEFKTGLKLSGTVTFQDAPNVRLVNDQFAGTRGQGRRLTGYSLRIYPEIPNLNLQYMAHLEGIGDSAWVDGGGRLSVGSQSRRLEGFAIRLTGTDAAKYSVSYMVYLSMISGTNFQSDSGQWFPFNMTTTI
jgi:hypothetical protein